MVLLETIIININIDAKQCSCLMKLNIQLVNKY